MSIEDKLLKVIEGLQETIRIGCMCFECNGFPKVTYADTSSDKLNVGDKV